MTGIDADEEPGGICPGPCNNGYRRARKIYRAARIVHAQEAARAAQHRLKVPDPPQPPKIRPWYGEPIWCGIDHALIRAALADFDDLGSLVATLPPGIKPASDQTRERVKVSGSHEQQSPSPSADTVDDLGGWLRHWEARIRRAAPRNRRGILANERTIIVGWLVDHLDSILVRPDVSVAFGTETLRWYPVLIRASHAAREATWVPKPCPGCKKRTLWERPGETYISCVNRDCNRRLTREELANAA